MPDPQLGNSVAPPSGLGALERSAEASAPASMLFVAQLTTIERLAVQFFGMLLLLVFIYSIAASITSASPAAFFHAIGVLLALILAAAAAGGLLGFLFGIPRSLQRPSIGQLSAPVLEPAMRSDAGSRPPGEPVVNQAAAAVSIPFYSSNTNLEDISDWVTKIIVGLGLIQAKTIASRLWVAASSFKAAMPGALGSDVLFMLICLAASVGGFLFFYLETRTRIVLLFVYAESAAKVVDRSKAEAASKVNQTPILDVTSNPMLDADARAPRPAPAPKEDAKFLSLTIDKLKKDAAEFSAWASAQARAGNLQAANTALQQAITLAPGDKDLLVKLAETHALQGRWNDAARALAEAEEIGKDDPELLKRDLFVSLYLQPPDGFARAISIADKLMANPQAAKDTNLLLWLAAAQGQRAGYYKDRDPAQYEDARTKALQAVQTLVDLQPEPASPYRKALRGMLDPSRETTPQIDNDLEIFKGDPAFEKLIFGS
ncbi:tetratricopeptide repeat protein [Bradyrhizobium acaciae]|uniref:tetratricopeptide repeat protein n=1 Tax=Bradyrhizobium acaciae TaxID=2683706 RepID=UPI001E53B833|nr:tetratricopeptide repeat protein [Bradyrhizobium acaciae]MCC8978542.1 tetratricopeptide repeat protein [Bradyrhizobium acaciae]